MFKLTENKVILIFIGFSLFVAVHCNSMSINLNRNVSNYMELPRFWTNSGFSPSAPLPFNRLHVVDQLKADDVYRNLDLISALPNRAVKYIRMHWLLSLVEFKGLNLHHIPVYQFTALDQLLDHLDSVRLIPVIEFMGHVFPQQKRHDTRFMWKDFTYQLVSHYLTRYGRSKLLQWRFELWNEPDLHTYNILNFNLNDYLDYVAGVSEGLEAAARSSADSVIHFQVHGPAGLFKSFGKHPLCWGLLEKCNLNITQCPINVLTFHRKGFDIVTDTDRLITDIHSIYPNLTNMPYANTECDPFAGWSRVHSTNANVFYAHTLATIVLDHWNAIYSKRLQNLQYISHDNSFLSYHPFEFEQRTLLARFAINNTVPRTLHFIQKPVYAALGLLASLADYATHENVAHNIRYLITKNRDYVAALLLSEDGFRVTAMKIRFTDLPNANRMKFAYFAEYLHQNQTDPYAVWMKYGRPSYPNATVLAGMHQAQGPHILRKPQIIHTNQSHFQIRIKLHHPWLILVRVCSNLIAQPTKVENVRIKAVDKYTILLLWHDHESTPSRRCIKTYEIFYKPYNDPNNNAEWTLITRHKHIPFLSYCHAIESNNTTTLNGFYRIRAVDVFGRYGDFSEAHEYKM